VSKLRVVTKTVETFDDYDEARARHSELNSAGKALEALCSPRFGRYEVTQILSDHDLCICKVDKHGCIIVPMTNCPVKGHDRLQRVRGGE